MSLCPHCPTCGSLGPYDVLAPVTFRLNSDGPDKNFTLTWDCRCNITCIKCGAVSQTGDLDKGSVAYAKV